MTGGFCPVICQLKFGTVQSLDVITVKGDISQDNQSDITSTQSLMNVYAQSELLGNSAYAQIAKTSAMPSRRRNNVHRYYSEQAMPDSHSM